MNTNDIFDNIVTSILKEIILMADTKVDYDSYIDLTYGM